MSDDPRDVPLEGLLDLVVDLVCDRIRGFEIGRVTAYDSAKQKVSVQPVVQRSHLDESGKRVSKPSQEVHDAIVVFPGAATGRITVPVARGDYGLIIYSSVSLDRWKLRGGLVDPGDDRRHDPSDAVFVPGAHDFAHVPTPAPTDAVVVHAGLGVGIKLGSPAAVHKAVLGTPYRAAENTLNASLGALVAALGVYATAIKAVADPTNAATPALLTAVANFAAALGVFNAGATTYLSQKVSLE